MGSIIIFHLSKLWKVLHTVWCNTPAEAEMFLKAFRNNFCVRHEWKGYCVCRRNKRAIGNSGACVHRSNYSVSTIQFVCLALSLYARTYLCAWVRGPSTAQTLSTRVRLCRRCRSLVLGAQPGPGAGAALRAHGRAQVFLDVWEHPGHPAETQPQVRAGLGAPGPLTPVTLLLPPPISSRTPAPAPSPSSALS